MLVVVQHAVDLGVGDDHEVRLAETLLAKALAELLEAHGHDGELLRLASLEVRLERALEVHVGDDVAAHEDEIRADDVAVVDQAHRLAGADAVVERDEHRRSRARRSALFSMYSTICSACAQQKTNTSSTPLEARNSMYSIIGTFTRGRSALGRSRVMGAESLREIEAGAGEGTSAIAQERDGGAGDPNSHPARWRRGQGGART